jgi:hypothetical protein
MNFPNYNTVSWAVTPSLFQNDISNVNFGLLHHNVKSINFATTTTLCQKHELYP